MKLLVGLGNPGRQYEATRHNVGFGVLDSLAARSGVNETRRTKFRSEIVQTQLAGESLLLMWPQTYMNLSGAAVGDAVDFYKIPPEDVLVVCDDFNLKLAQIRIRRGGSAGGQRGLEDILRRLNTNSVPRLRLGVGPLPPGWNAANYVLGRFTAEELEEVREAIVRAADAAACWVREGITACMNQFNHQPQTGEN